MTVGHRRSDALGAACKALGIHPEIILSDARSGRVAPVRDCIALCLYEGPWALSYPEIAAVLGRRSHTSCIQGVCRCAARMGERETMDSVRSVWRAMYGCEPPASLAARVARHRQPRPSRTNGGMQRKEAAC